MVETLQTVTTEEEDIWLQKDELGASDKAPCIGGASSFITSSVLSLYICYGEFGRVSTTVMREKFVLYSR